MSVFTFSPYLPIVYGAPGAPERWRVFPVGDKFGDGILWMDKGRVIDWNPDGRLFAVWSEFAHIQLRLAYSDDNGATWTHADGTVENTPWSYPTSYNSWYVASGAASPMVALSSGRIAAFETCFDVYEDTLGQLSGEPSRQLHRAVWSPTAFSLPIGSRNWSLRRFYDAGAGYEPRAFAARAFDHSKYGLLLLRRRTSPADYFLLYNDLDGNGDFPNTPVGSNPAAIEEVHHVSGVTDAVSSFALVFAGGQPKAIWYDNNGQAWYKHRTAQGWPTGATQVTDPNATEVYVIAGSTTKGGTPSNTVDPFAYYIHQALHCFAEDFSVYGIYWNSADNNNDGTNFKFRDRRGLGAWTDMTLVDMRQTESPPSSLEADSPQAWVIGGSHETYRYEYAVAPWIKDGRYLFVLLSTAHGHRPKVSLGADPDKDGEPYRDNPFIADDVYSVEQEWLLRLDLGAAGGRKFR